MNRIERITEMERCLNVSREALDALEKAFSAYEAVQKNYRRLCGYYSSPRWMEDLEADEAGKLPENLNRGVLSEDAVYDLIKDSHDLAARILKTISSAMESNVL